jgi:hypothetical protein
MTFNRLSESGFLMLNLLWLSLVSIQVQIRDERLEFREFGRGYRHGFVPDCLIHR